MMTLAIYNHHHSEHYNHNHGENHQDNYSENNNHIHGENYINNCGDNYNSNNYIKNYNFYFKFNLYFSGVEERKK